MDQPALKVGDQVTWAGSLKIIMGNRTGTIVEVLPNPTLESHFASYIIRRNDGVEGLYYRTQLEPLSSVRAPKVFRISDSADT